MRNLWLLVLLRGVALSSPIHAALVDGGRKHRPVAEPGSPEFWFHLTVSAVLVLLGGVFAGLTLGLMGLDDLHLRVLATSSEDPYEQRNAKQVLQLMSKGRHWILVVSTVTPRSHQFIQFRLRFCSCVMWSSMKVCPSFWTAPLAEESPQWLSLQQQSSFLGTCLMKLHCSNGISKFHSREIIPQAVCVRYGLAIGAKCAPFVLALMWILSPIAYPIAKLLDWVLGGEEHNTYKKAELKSFLQFHRTGEEPLRDDEINILNGVLELNTKKVETIMTCIEDTVTLSSDTILDHAKVDSILSSGYSRFPVHTPEDPTAFIGLLLIKKLLTYDPAKALPVSAFPLSILPEAYPSINCFQALDYFQTGRAHLLLISRTPGQAGGAIGVITLEDIIEVNELSAS
ncbi:hypothetical protein H2248_010115 [Termitomyces sp. 'cryptogamus']|nr:hypothetical protein H2248_010115 [Termitomyces sp. 'cryptogamus']